MVSVGLCILDSIAMIETVIKISQMYTILFNSTSVNTTKGPIVPETETPIDGKKPEVTIEQYSRHWLCKDVDTQRYFYKAMKLKFCSSPFTSTFVANLVMDLCKQQDFMLDKWVKELFDFDDDGYISHLEKTYYTR
ncbi:uncharacterized protein LOC123538912 isoform X2 [Mercenaria mercenaria]|uniref:uncharacterized protein LOC123538912 isoform X2 n=1 Tax=Mercenaria mercenaria TaxID=6596 RepID=UPI00234FADFE|nr:uncharacterized protein LOC123538912 isoform X2 [Mercenaria mercenaria]